MGEARTYDAWGQVRSQVGTDGKLRYCANLGHKQDDESGLIYMRARYYEPSSGRFVSEDPALAGENWFSYCKNNPVNLVDPTGTTGEDVFTPGQKFGLGLFGAFIVEIAKEYFKQIDKYGYVRSPERILLAALKGVFEGAVIGFGISCFLSGAGLIAAAGVTMASVAGIIAYSALVAVTLCYIALVLFLLMEIDKAIDASYPS